MNNFLSNIKLYFSKNRLRQVKYYFSDSFNSFKYQMGIQLKMLNINNLTKYLKKDPTIAMSESEKKEIYEKLLDTNLSKIDLYPFIDSSPLISIIISNKNGHAHLKRLFKNFEKNIQYPSYEIIVIDNGSDDASITYLEQLIKTLPLKIIRNSGDNNDSANVNSAVQIANGEYILLVDSNIEPTFGWLNQMVQTAMKSEDMGAIGAKLVYPYCSNSEYNKNNSFKIRNVGIGFKEDNDGLFIPYCRGKGLEPFDNKFMSKNFNVAAISSILLVQKNKFLLVEGLDEKYLNGYEDVDLCLKLQQKGYKNFCSTNALIFHHESWLPSADLIKRNKESKELFNQKWNKYLKRQILTDKLNNTRLFSEKPLKIAFAVTENGENAVAGDYFTGLEFGEAMKKLGWEISFLSQKTGNWYRIDADVDVLISLLDRYDARKIKSLNKFLIKIAWPRNWFDRWVSNPGFSDYNIILANSKVASEYIKRKSGKNPILMLLATNSERFNRTISSREEYSCDYCFTGSYWNVPREIIEMLDPEKLPYKFNLYGKNWDKIDKFKKYNKGFIKYSNLPEVYASTKIVIDDANIATKDYGAVNSRVYDALASGALVLTNGKKGANETFNGELPVFKSKDELNSLIRYYLSNKTERTLKVNKLKKFVLKSHTYENRASTLKEILQKYRE